MSFAFQSIQRLLARQRVKRSFKKRLGYALNLNNPSSYCEKIQWLKLYYLEHHPEVIQCTDKFEVRSYLERKGLAAILPKLYGVWDRPSEIQWEHLPNQFVLKLNNGSGGSCLWMVKNKDDLDFEKCVRQIEASQKRRYGFHKGEFHYAKIKPKIIAEEFLGDDIEDYKFYCFNGEVAFFSIETHRHTRKHVRAYYTPDFEKSHVQFCNDLSPPQEPQSRPRKFAEMLELAQSLSLGQPHVRVDLYHSSDAIFFGELTFSPESGYTKWRPRELDFQFGELIDLRLAKSFLANAT